MKYDPEPVSYTHLDVYKRQVQYAKTRPVFDEYKAAKYSKRFLAQHEAELADYRAAKAALNDLLDGVKLPKMAQLKEKRRKLAAEKKALYAKYRAAQQEMRQAVAVKTNIDYLLGEMCIRDRSRSVPRLRLCGQVHRRSRGA